MCSLYAIFIACKWRATLFVEVLFAKKLRKHAGKDIKDNLSVECN